MRRHFLCLMLIVGIIAIFSLGPASAALKSVGPVNPANGYPYWYEDQSGQRLQLCLDFIYGGPDAATGGVLNNAPCLVDPDPATLPGGLVVGMEVPMVFPTRWSGENFWYMASADFQDGLQADGTTFFDYTVPHKRTLVEFAVEATFDADVIEAGHQVSFARMRIRLTELAPNTLHTIIHPFGVEQITTDAAGEINHTEDVGLQVGVFTGALAGRLGPFLEWDAAAWTPTPNVTVQPILPDGFLGDPGVSHEVKNGINNNMVRVMRGQANGTLVMQTKKFVIMGKVATSHGAGIQEATYSRAAGGSGVIDVAATSVAGQNLSLLNAANSAVLGGLTPYSVMPTHYYGRTTFSASPVPAIAVRNNSDTPLATQSVTVTPKDKVVISQADYTFTNPGVSTAGRLEMLVHSSDQFAPPTFTLYDGAGPVDGSGQTVTPIAGNVAANRIAIAMNAPPVSVTAVSSHGGSAKEAVQFVDARFLPRLRVPAVAPSNFLLNP